jgi:hypothetical protein
LAFLFRDAYANNLNWQHAADALLMTVLGGVYHFLGPLWGATAFIVLKDQLSGLIEHWWLIFAPIIIAFILLSPEGIHGLVQNLMGNREMLPKRPDVIAPYHDAIRKLVPTKPILSVQGLSKRFDSLVTASNIFANQGGDKP